MHEIALKGKANKGVESSSDSDSTDDEQGRTRPLSLEENFSIST